MRIVSSRKDDVLRRKAEYEADFERRQSEYDGQLNTFNEAQYSVTESVKSYFEKLFSKYPLLDARINVDANYAGNGVRVYINVDENNKFKDNVSLSWSYDAHISNDQLIRETSSWSGMSAVTADQLSHLEQCLGALKDLAEVDWNTILNTATPKYSDYVTVANPRWDRNRPDFKRELLEAEIEDIIGQRKVIEVGPFSSSWYRNGSYVAILKDTGKQYVIKEWPKYIDTNEISGRFDTTESRRVKKSAIIPVQPINILEV